MHAKLRACTARCASSGCGFEKKVLARAAQGIKDVVAQLLQSFNHGPCPSPMVLEYLKETLVMSWASDAALVDQTIRDICASEHCSPAVPVCMLRFRIQGSGMHARVFQMCAPDICGHKSGVHAVFTCACFHAQLGVLPAHHMPASCARLMCPPVSASSSGSRQPWIYVEHSFGMPGASASLTTWRLPPACLPLCPSRPFCRAFPSSSAASGTGALKLHTLTHTHTHTLTLTHTCSPSQALACSRCTAQR